MKYKYIIFTEDYNVYGTNSKEEANTAAENEIVFNLETGEAIGVEEEDRMFGVQEQIDPWSPGEEKPAEAGSES